MSLKWHVTTGEILGFFYIILQVVLAILPRERIPVTADYIIQEENKDIILLITLHNALTRFEKFVPSSVEKV
jgi:hypothetical protein